MGTPPANPELLETFLAGRDAPCPRCGYNLRGTAAEHCPECGQMLVLSIADPDPRTAWDVLAMFAVVLTVLYFAVRASFRLIGVLARADNGLNPSSIRLELGINAVIELAISLGGVFWCLLIVRCRNRRPRPVWARPTTAASGLLLAVFVAFLLAYGVRTLL